MSVTKVVRSKSATASAIYVAYGTVENLDNRQVRAARLTLVTPFLEGVSVLNFAMTARMNARKNDRKIETINIIQSWSPEELSIYDDADIDKAHTAGLLLAEVLAPGADVMVATHTDSKGGHVHNHIVIANHDRLTGKSVTGNGADFHPAVKAANDLIMRDMGLQVLEPQPEAIPWAERGQLTDSNWREVMRGQIALLVADERVAGAASVDDALDAMQEFAGDYRLSFGRRGATGQRKTNNASSFALLDDDGEVMRVPSKGKTVECKSRGSKLGKDYTVKGLRGVLEAAMQEHARQQIIQQEIAALEAAVEAEKEEDDHDLAGQGERGSERRFSADFGGSEGAEHEDSGARGAGDAASKDDRLLADTTGFSESEIQRAVERLRGEVEGLRAGVADAVEQHDHDRQERERRQQDAQQRQQRQEDIFAATFGTITDNEAEDQSLEHGGGEALGR